MKILKNPSNKATLSIFILLYLSLVFGFFYNEDIAGGGVLDRTFQKHLLSQGFMNGINGFLTIFYPLSTIIHSPVYYILIHKLENIFNNDILFRFFLLNISILIPLCLINILKTIYNKSNLIIIIPLLLFLSPNFRTIAIWSGREIFSLIFLCVSIYYYLDNFNMFKIKNILLSFLFLSLASYISYEYGFISIIYFYKLFKDSKDRHYLYPIIIYNFFLSLPLFIYIIKFIELSDYNQSITLNTFHNINYFFSTYFLYSIPFLFLKNDFIKFINKSYFNIFFLLIFFFLSTQFVPIPEIGGGAVNKILILINLPKLIFIFSAMGFLSFIYLMNKNLLFNYIVLIVFILQTCISYHFFQKYFDLMFIIYFFIFFKVNNLEKIIYKKKIFTNLIIFYIIYFFGLLIFRTTITS